MWSLWLRINPGIAMRATSIKACHMTLCSPLSYRHICGERATTVKACHMTRCSSLSLLPDTCAYSPSPMNHFLHCRSPPDSFSQHFLSSCGEPGPQSGDSSLPGSTPTSWLLRVHLLLCSEAPTRNIIPHDRMSFHVHTKIALASVC